MLIGCDIAQMDDFTLGLLCNNEVNAIDQDILGKQADRVYKDDRIEIWSRPLVDGGQAVGIFNVSDNVVTYDLNTYQPATDASIVRDLWRQKNLSPTERTWTIPPHGCRYLKLM